MSGFFVAGERKDRPGIYKRIVNRGGVELAGATAGVGCAVVTGNWGPLNKAMLVQNSDNYADFVGKGKGYDVLSELFRDGPETAIVVRVGDGGKEATIKLKDDASTGVDVLSFTSKYVGTRPLSVSIRESLADPSVREISIYENLTKLETETITAGKGEVDQIVDAFKDSKYVFVEKLAAGSGKMKLVSQVALEGGEDPTVTTESYSAGFNATEPEDWDEMCVDTDDTAVHALMVAFVDRLYNSGLYPQCTQSENIKVTLDKRMADAKAVNDAKGTYVLGGWVDASGKVYDGYLAAARIAGMKAAKPANESLTHDVISGAVDVAESLTNAEIIEAIKHGCLVITKSRSGDVRIEKAINTLTTPAANEDAGWKKIRRVKTRFEMMKRIELTTDQLVGNVNNDDNGRAAVIGAGQGVLDAMVGEGKLFAGATMYLDKGNPPEGDSAWFIIDADDIDSFEFGYLTFRFRFAPEAAE